MAMSDSSTMLTSSGRQSGPKNQQGEVLTVVVLCGFWYAVSSSNNVIGKMVLNVFPYPMTMTMVQLLSISVYSGPFFNWWGVRKYVDISWPYYFRLIVPLAIGKFVASVFTHVSIWKVPVSYAHTVKSTMPLFTVILSRVIMGEKQTWKVYFSLVPIIMGVAIVTATELSFDVVGLVSALLATMGFSLQHIFSKKVLHDTGVHHLRLLHILGRLALFLFLPIWMFTDMFSLINDARDSLTNANTMGLLFLDGALNWLQNIIAFSIISMVTPLTYAVANASKRIFVIGLSLIVLGNAVTATNVFGMFVAILGVLYYNKAKYDAKKEMDKETLLPFSQKSWSDRSGYRMVPTTNTNGFLPMNGTKNSGHSNGYSSYNSKSSNILFA